MYHQLVHLLDLCTYCYQLHNQTLIWPMDPYYDQFSGIKGRRNGLMAKVHEYAAAQPKSTLLRGPGCLLKWDTNKDLDPILSDYSKIDPWKPSVVRPNRETEGWILYNTPEEITQRIKGVLLARYESGSDAQNPKVKLDSIPGLAEHRSRPDRLYCFEGGTGAIKRKNKEPAWSVMGLVLARKDDSAPKIPGNTSAHPYPYDIYIVFRGSRSGDPRALRALRKERGNPDWVTDMDFGADRGVVGNISEISETGSVSPGFAASVLTMLPTVMACLNDIQTKITYPPRTIYVTGHSLAAALAVHFTSAMLLGSTYGYTLSGGKMPDPIRTWPWSSTQLVPFALPVVGGESFHDAFNLTLASRPVYLSGDPVTQRLRGYAVGLPYRLVPESVSNLDQRGGRISALRHEPFNIRKYLLKDLEKKGIKLDGPPKEPWETYEDFKEMLLRLEKDPKADPNAKVSEILGTDFNLRLVEYLGILKKFVDNTQKPKVELLIAAIKAIDRLPSVNRNLIRVIRVGDQAPYQLLSLEDIYARCKGILPAQGADKSDRNNFDNFIGLCLFLSLASNSKYKDAVYHASQPPFEGLPFT
jgi:hypothetical protein